jgi:hypothetical protein
MFQRLRLVLVPCLCLTASLLSSCGNDKPAATSTEKPAAAPAAEVHYVCPMGCAGSESTKPGKCPVCGMALEKKA